MIESEANLDTSDKYVYVSCTLSNKDIVLTVTNMHEIMLFAWNYNTFRIK